MRLNNRHDNISSTLILYVIEENVHNLMNFVFNFCYTDQLSNIILFDCLFMRSRCVRRTDGAKRKILNNVCN